ncbi:hypothetical protein JRO89_XS04G0126500 [Xanthoceras sorbifolium]|uniref:Uncharacterized protein n=1 Tax=Xanthoceras sorbifolium TaxID=99658 RepID=A0ABQ8I521_9ROSI|nr:hypothetical protein JRO89_XS04G0126500 [Xanthoceras sorbifolium]
MNITCCTVQRDGKEIQLELQPTEAIQNGQNTSNEVEVDDDLIAESDSPIFKTKSLAEIYERYNVMIAKEVPATVNDEASGSKGQGVGQSREAPDQSDTLKLTNIESTTSSEGEKATLDNLGKALVCRRGRDSREEKEPSNNHGKGNKALCAAGEGKRVADKATKRTVGEMVIRTEAMTKRDTASKLGQGQKAGLYNGPDPLNGEIDNVDASLMEGVSHDLGPRRGKHGSRSPTRRILYNKIFPPVSPEVGSKRKDKGISTDDSPLKPVEVLLDSAAGFLSEFHNTISAVLLWREFPSSFLFHAIREAQRNGEVKMVHCKSEEKVADILTKALASG